MSDFKTEVAFSLFVLAVLVLLLFRGPSCCKECDEVAAKRHARQSQGCD